MCFKASCVFGKNTSRGVFFLWFCAGWFVDIGVGIFSLRIGVRDSALGYWDDFWWLHKIYSFKSILAGLLSTLKKKIIDAMRLGFSILNPMLYYIWLVHTKEVRSSYWYLFCAIRNFITTNNSMNAQMTPFFMSQ